MKLNFTQVSKGFFKKDPCPKCLVSPVCIERLKCNEELYVAYVKCLPNAEYRMMKLDRKIWWRKHKIAFESTLLVLNIIIVSWIISEIAVAL